MAIVKNNEWIAIDSVEHDDKLKGTGRPGDPLTLNGDLGIKYDGISPVIVDNENKTIEVETVELQVQHPIIYEENTNTLKFDKSVIPDSYTKTEIDKKFQKKLDTSSFNEFIEEYNEYKESVNDDFDEINEKFQEKLDTTNFNEFIEEYNEYKESVNDNFVEIDNDIDNLSNAINTKQNLLSAGQNIEIINDTISVTGQLGKIYTGIDPIIVDNDNDNISVNVIDLKAGDNIEITETETEFIINAVVPTIEYCTIADIDDMFK